MKGKGREKCWHTGIQSGVIIQLLMSHLELFSKLKRRTHSLITEPAQGLQKQHSYQNKFSPLLNSRPQNASREGYSKALPKNIPYDKQSLYFEVLSLKKELNQLMDDNIRLKTRNIALEQELDSLGKKSSQEKRSVLRSRMGKHEGARPSENPFVDGLKQMLKQSKKEAQVLKNQNIKMKKSVKLSKINELELENEAILQENQRLSKLNEDFQKRMDHARLLQDKNHQLERNRVSLVADVKRLEQEITTLQSYIQAIQLEHKYNYPSKNRLWQPSIPRRGNAGMKNLEQLRKQFLNSREAAFRINRKDPKSKLNQGLLLRKDPIIVTHLLEGLKEPNQIKHLEEENRKLKIDKEQLEATIKRIQEGQEKANIRQEKPQETGQKNQEQQNGPNQHQEIVNKENEEPKYSQRNKREEKEDKQEKEERQWQQGERSEEIKLQYNSVQGFLQSGATPPKVAQQHSKAFSEPEAQFGERSVFKSNRRIIDEICEILSSRMRAQRYTFSELQTDIEKSAAKEFSYVDLCHMLVNQPFYLTVDYCRILLCFILEKDRPSHIDHVASMTLIAKLRKVIKDFNLPSQEDEHLMVQHCAQVITNHSKEVRSACEQAKGSEGRLSAGRLKEVLEKFGLSHSQMEMVIGELAICSPSLSNLDLQVLFQRFDLEEISDNIIQEQENDDSFIHMSKNREETVSKKGSAELFSTKKARVKSKIEQQLKT